MKSVAIKSIDEYIGACPEGVREILEQIRQTIKKAAPEAEEKISYQMPTFYLHDNLVHFAAYKKHVGFYPGPSGLKAYYEEISRYKNSKGAVQFPLDRPMPLKLIEKIVRFRVKENTEKAGATTKKTAAKK